MTTRPYAIVDVESRSKCDLPEKGIDAYLADASTSAVSIVALHDGRCRVWVNAAHFTAQTGMPAVSKLVHDTRLFATVNGAAPVRAVDVSPQYGDPGAIDVTFCAGVPRWFRDLAKTHTFVGHNATGFDAPFCRRILGVKATWLDTLHVARIAGLPGGLDAIGTALLGVGKHEGSKVLRLFYDADKPAPFRQLWTLVSYNIADCLITARLLDEVTPWLDDVETPLIRLHEQINARGVRYDAALGAALVEYSHRAREEAGAEIEAMTQGALSRKDLRSRVKMMAWLASVGFATPDLRKETLNRLIADPDAYFLGEEETGVQFASVAPIVPRVLRLRSAATRITSAKIERIREQVGPDSRLRRMLVYHGAHTGRFSSRVVQLHNLSRGVAKCRVADLLADGVPTYDAIAAEAQRLRTAGMGWVTVDDVLATLLRYVLTASPGGVLGIVDYAAIEARGLAWLAGEEKLVDAFRAGRDVYCDFGAMLFGRLITKKDEAERQIAKVTVLGAGYGLGSEKFAFYAANAGVDLASVGVTAEQCIEAYRDAYPHIAGRRVEQRSDAGYVVRQGGVWRNLSDAVFAAVRDGRQTNVAKCTVGTWGGHLVIALPSGRELIYRNARVEDVIPRWGGDPRPAVTYDHQHGYRKQLYGGLIVENVTQAVCRDVLTTALLRLDAAGFPIVLHVHDEIVAELRDAARLDEMQRLMSEVPTWAAGFPIAVEGHTSTRYGKIALTK